MLLCGDEPAGNWCPRALAWCFVAGAIASAGTASAATLVEKARESGCVGKPVAISEGLFKCSTSSGGDAFFNVPGVLGTPPSSSGATGVRKPADKSTTPSGFPRVDAETQKGRDDLRKKVLSDELAAEEKSLADARMAYDSGAPAPLPEEKADAEKYRQRIGRLRQAVQLHERNVDALKKELGNAR
jgi:hypothetical protein